MSISRNYLSRVVIAGMFSTLMAIPLTAQAKDDSAESNKKSTNAIGLPVNFLAFQDSTTVTLLAYGEFPTGGYEARLKKLAITIWPPQFRLVIKKPNPGDVVTQQITPFVAVASFSADEPISKLLVHDAAGNQQDVVVIQATRSGGESSNKNTQRSSKKGKSVKSPGFGTMKDEMKLEVITTPSGTEIFRTAGGTEIFRTASGTEIIRTPGGTEIFSPASGTEIFRGDGNPSDMTAFKFQGKNADSNKKPGTLHDIDAAVEHPKAYHPKPGDIIRCFVKKFEVGEPLSNLDVSVEGNSVKIITIIDSSGKEDPGTELSVFLIPTTKGLSRVTITPVFDTAPPPTHPYYVPFLVSE